VVVKVKAAWSWGYTGPWGIKSWRPYKRICDDLCNPVWQFTLPWVGYVEVWPKPGREYIDGLWVTSGGSTYGGGLAECHIYTYGHGRRFVSAMIPMTPDELEAAMGTGEEHPRIWTDAEVFDLACEFERYNGDSDDFESVDDVRDYLGR
jgi:hypothetical protein